MGIEFFGFFGRFFGGFSVRFIGQMLWYSPNVNTKQNKKVEVNIMGTALIILGIIYAVYKICEEASWNTNAYDGKELDVDAMFRDTCVEMTCGRMTKSQVKRKYKNGGYAKKL